jgi:hypothetical protein
VEAIKALVQLGVDKEEKDDAGQTALHVAAGARRVEVIRTLLEVGVDSLAKDAYGRTPRLRAEIAGQNRAVEAMQLGADVNAPGPASNGLVETLVSSTVPLLLLFFAFFVFKRLSGNARGVLKSTARAHQAAAREHPQQAAERDMAEARETADRVAAEILEEEEREEAAAAQTKVRLAPPSPHIGLQSVQLGGDGRWRRFCRTGERLPAHCMTCSGDGAYHSVRRATARPRLATAGRPPRRRRGAAVRAARRRGAAAPVHIPHASSASARRSSSGSAGSRRHC